MAGPPAEPPDSPPPDEEAQEAAARRMAQDAAADLARMGIDPEAVGLGPALPEPAPQQATATSAATGAAPPPSPGVVPDGKRQRSWIQPFRPATPGGAGGEPGREPRPQEGTAPGSPAHAMSVVTPGIPLWPGDSGAPAPVAGPAETPVQAPGQPVAPGPAPAEAPPDRYDIVVPAGWRRLARAVTFGVATPGAAQAMAAERRLVKRARTRQREPKVVALLAGKGGVGTTTTALGMALTLAALRNDPAVLVDARAGASSLARRVGDRPAPTTLEVTGDATEVAAVPPLALPSGLHIVDGAPWHSPPSRAEFVRLLDQLPARFPFTLVDIGNETADAARGALALASRVVLVTSPTVDALEGVRTALARIVQANPAALASVVIALVCRSRRSHWPVAHRLTGELGLSHVVCVPYDRSLALGQQVAPTRMRPATREAYLTLAAHVADPPHTTATQQTVSPAGLLDGPLRPRE